MSVVRKYGESPFKVAVIHGGPGAPGSMSPVANGLKNKFGILEPIQSADSVDGQIEELYNQLKTYDPPFILIGHSWGAWLSWMLAAKHPEITSHIILVGSGPFSEEYMKGMMETRLGNLSADERQTVKSMLEEMKYSELTKSEFAVFGKLMSKSDSYCPADSLYGENPLPLQPEIYESVWAEAAELRKSGKLLSMAENIKCKITFIHGKNDPHPYKGIQDVLNGRGVDFEFILLDKCGHIPWKEKYRAADFFSILTALVEESI